MSHSHSHDHYDGEQPHDHSHDHSHDDDVTPALQNLLYEQIDFSAVQCLNEAEPRSASKILQKTWTERNNPEPELNSDVDEQLLLHIPFVALLTSSDVIELLNDTVRFAGQVRLHSILIRTSTTPSAPSTLHLHINRDDLDFTLASDLTPTQTLSIGQSNDVQEYPVKRALFNSTRSLDLFFEDNWGGGDEDVTRISYLGFKGEFMKLSKEPISFLYEAAANPADHATIAGVRGEVGSRIGGAGGHGF
jgi:hypothetical protein